MLDECNINELRFSAVGPKNYKLNIQLMTLVPHAILAIPGVKLMSGPHLSRWVSAIQQAFGELTPTLPEETGFDRHIQYVSAHSFAMRAKTRLPERMIVASAIRLFQFDCTEEADNWACFNWGNYTSVPASWRQTRNYLKLARDTETIDCDKCWCTHDIHHMGSIVVQSIALTVNITPKAE